MRLAFGLLLTVPMAAAGAFTMLALPTGSPASDFFAIPAAPDAPRAAPMARIMRTASEPVSASSAPIIVAQALPVLPVQTRSTGSAMVIGTVGGGIPAIEAPTGNAGARQMSRGELVSSLQKELKRVGCYSGDANGEWTPASQQAMKSFLQRLNASLPTADPDFILLTLVQGQTSLTCKADCPTGQAMLDNGRCVPAATLTQRSPGPRATPAELAVGGHVTTAAPKAAENAGSWRTTVTARQDNAPAAQVQAQSSAKAGQRIAEITVQAAPAPALAGRMAIGGPIGQLDSPLVGQQPPANAPLPSNLNAGNSGNASSGKSRSTSSSSSPPPRRAESRERTAEAPRSRPSRDSNWTKNFFER